MGVLIHFCPPKDAAAIIAELTEDNEGRERKVTGLRNSGLLPFLL